jgi:hypothetical protein
MRKSVVGGEVEVSAAEVRSWSRVRCDAQMTTSGAWLRLMGQEVLGVCQAAIAKGGAEGQRGRRIVIDCEDRGAVADVGERAMLGS